MERLIVLLRGVMPTGKNRVPMAELRKVLDENGFPGARTWIQSGNVLIKSSLDALETAAEVKRLIREHIGPDLAVIAKTPEEVKAVLAENPFGDLAPDRVFYTLWNGEIDREKAEALSQTDFGEERLHISPRAAYLFIPGSAARSKLSNNFLERRLGASLTTRNRNTLQKLVELWEEK